MNFIEHACKLTQEIYYNIHRRVNKIQKINYIIIVTSIIFVIYT